MVALIIALFLTPVTGAEILGQNPHRNQEARLRVAVIDEAVDVSKLRDSRFLCRDGHKDFSGEGVFNKTPLSHGSRMVNIITKDVSWEKACVTIIRYYSASVPGDQNVLASVRAIRWARTIEAPVVNYSGGGLVGDSHELDALRELVNFGATIVVAAGNESSNLSLNCDYFPACYAPQLEYPRNFFVVENVSSKTGRRVSTSNYGGPVNTSEVGENVSDGFSVGTGTSEAAARKTNRLLRSMGVH